MLKCMDRFITEFDPTQVVEMDMNNVTFVQDESMVKVVADTWAQVMIVQFGAVEFKTLKDIYEEQKE